MGDEYHVEGVRILSGKNFTVACTTRWDTDEFPQAAHYAISTTLETDKRLEGYCLSDYCEEYRLTEQACHRDPSHGGRWNRDGHHQDMCQGLELDANRVVLCCKRTGIGKDEWLGTASCGRDINVTGCRYGQSWILCETKRTRDKRRLFVLKKMARINALYLYLSSVRALW